MYLYVANWIIYFDSDISQFNDLFFSEKTHKYRCINVKKFVSHPDISKLNQNSVTFNKSISWPLGRDFSPQQLRFLIEETTL